MNKQLSQLLFFIILFQFIQTATEVTNDCSDRANKYHIKQNITQDDRNGQNIPNFSYITSCINQLKGTGVDTITELTITFTDDPTFDQDFEIPSFEKFFKKNFDLIINFAQIGNIDDDLSQFLDAAYEYGIGSLQLNLGQDIQQNTQQTLKEKFIDTGKLQPSQIQVKGETCILSDLASYELCVNLSFNENEMDTYCNNNYDFSKYEKLTLVFTDITKLTICLTFVDVTVNQELVLDLTGAALTNHNFDTSTIITKAKPNVRTLNLILKSTNFTYPPHIDSGFSNLQTLKVDYSNNNLNQQQILDLLVYLKALKSNTLFFLKITLSDSNNDSNQINNVSEIFNQFNVSNGFFANNYIYLNDGIKNCFFGPGIFLDGCNFISVVAQLDQLQPLKCPGQTLNLNVDLNQSVNIPEGSTVTANNIEWSISPSISGWNLPLNQNNISNLNMTDSSIDQSQYDVKLSAESILVDNISVPFVILDSIFKPQQCNAYSTIKINGQDPKSSYECEELIFSLDADNIVSEHEVVVNESSLYNWNLEKLQNNQWVIQRQNVNVQNLILEILDQTSSGYYRISLNLTNPVIIAKSFIFFIKKCPNPEILIDGIIQDGNNLNYLCGNNLEISINEQSENLNGVVINEQTAYEWKIFYNSQQLTISDSGNNKNFIINKNEIETEGSYNVKIQLNNPNILVQHMFNIKNCPAAYITIQDEKVNTFSNCRNIYFEITIEHQDYYEYDFQINIIKSLYNWKIMKDVNTNQPLTVSDIDQNSGFVIQPDEIQAGSTYFIQVTKDDSNIIIEELQLQIVECIRSDILINNANSLLQYDNCNDLELSINTEIFQDHLSEVSYFFWFIWKDQVTENYLTVEQNPVTKNTHIIQKSTISEPGKYIAYCFPFPSNILDTEFLQFNIYECGTNPPSIHSSTIIINNSESVSEYNKCSNLVLGIDKNASSLDGAVIDESTNFAWKVMKDTNSSSSLSISDPDSNGNLTLDNSQLQAGVYFVQVDIDTPDIQVNEVSFTLNECPSNTPKSTTIQINNSNLVSEYDKCNNLVLGVDENASSLDGAVIDESTNFIWKIMKDSNSNSPLSISDPDTNGNLTLDTQQLQAGVYFVQVDIDTPDIQVEEVSFTLNECPEITTANLLINDQTPANSFKNCGNLNFKVDENSINNDQSILQSTNFSWQILDSDKSTPTSVTNPKNQNIFTILGTELSAGTYYIQVTITDPEINISEFQLNITECPPIITNFLKPKKVNSQEIQEDYFDCQDIIFSIDNSSIDSDINISDANYTWQILESDKSTPLSISGQKNQSTLIIAKDEVTLNNDYFVSVQTTNPTITIEEFQLTVQECPPMHSKFLINGEATGSTYRNCINLEFSVDEDNIYGDYVVPLDENTNYQWNILQSDQSTPLTVSDPKNLSTFTVTSQEIQNVGTYYVQATITNPNLIIQEFQLNIIKCPPGTTTLLINNDMPQDQYMKCDPIEFSVDKDNVTNYVEIQESSQYQWKILKEDHLTPLQISGLQNEDKLVVQGSEFTSLSYYYVQVTIQNPLVIVQEQKFRISKCQPTAKLLINDEQILNSYKNCDDLIISVDQTSITKNAELNESTIFSWLLFYKNYDNLISLDYDLNLDTLIINKNDIIQPGRYILKSYILNPLVIVNEIEFDILDCNYEKTLKVFMSINQEDPVETYNDCQDLVLSIGSYPNNAILLPGITKYQWSLTDGQTDILNQQGIQNNNEQVVIPKNLIKYGQFSLSLVISSPKMQVQDPVQINLEQGGASCNFIDPIVDQDPNVDPNADPNTDPNTDPDSDPENNNEQNQTQNTKKSNSTLNQFGIITVLLVFLIL